MYMWLTRFISGQAAGEAGPNASRALPIEYHGFVAPGPKYVRTLEPALGALLPWVRCAARHALRPAGQPPCAHMRDVDVLSMPE